MSLRFENLINVGPYKAKVISEEGGNLFECLISKLTIRQPSLPVQNLMHIYDNDRLLFMPYETSVEWDEETNNLIIEGKIITQGLNFSSPVQGIILLDSLANRNKSNKSSVIWLQ